MSDSRTCKVISCSHEDEPFVFVSYAHQNSDVVFPIIEGIDDTESPQGIVRQICVASDYNNVQKHSEA
ncbi:MAG: hypothetical protein LBQ90_12000 [Synergistaceae bacterium]|jgi:hypothetical protein|nr:hypothetical protein [Synergistaceae bacterium]